uniref:Uncharacterized protein n=1 Tax=Octopus bimaculoides TaxID=37653 RepID=A0A0L8FJQ9_OCTBM
MEGLDTTCMMRGVARGQPILMSRNHYKRVQEWRQQTCDGSRPRMRYRGPRLNRVHYVSVFTSSSNTVLCVQAIIHFGASLSFVEHH